MDIGTWPAFWHDWWPAGLLHLEHRRGDELPGRYAFAAGTRPGARPAAASEDS